MLVKSKSLVISLYNRITRLRKVAFVLNIESFGELKKER